MSATSTSDSITNFVINLPKTVPRVIGELPWFAFKVLVAILIMSLAILLFRLIHWLLLCKRNSACLELTPPTNHNRTPEAGQELFQVMHSQRGVRPLHHKLIGRPIIVAPEIVSSREAGIRYNLQADPRIVKHLFHNLTVFSPDARITPTESTVPQASDNTAHSYTRIRDFKLRSSYAWPLAAHLAADGHDPLAQIIGSMSRLEPSEEVSFQVILTPIDKRNSTTIAHKIRANEDVLSYLERHTSAWSFFKHLLGGGAMGSLDLMSEVFNPTTTSSYSSAGHSGSRGTAAAREASRSRQALFEPMHQKVCDSLFRVSLRVKVTTSSKEATMSRLDSIQSSLGAYKTKFQELKPKRTIPFVSNRFRRFAFEHRMPAILHCQNMILSAAEVASLYHFPAGMSTKADNLMTSSSKTLEAPVTLKNGTKLDVLLGLNHHHGTTTDIGITAAEREKPVYIIGGTGNGKTTMIEYAVVQDMEAGRGVAVIDPHGDLATKLLRYVPKDRIKDVIYLNPVDIDYPIGLNLLELPTGLTKSKLLLEQQRVLDAVVSVLRKVFADDEANAYRIESILRNAILTAFTVPDATLFTVLKLLRNGKYRKTIVDKLTDEDLKDFWREEVAQAGDMQRVSMSKGVTARIDRFRSSEPVRRMFGQAKSTISFEEMMDSGKILICNLAQGEIGEDTSALFGTTILAKLKMASERRIHQLEEERRPYYIYVDEFQNFATTPFAKMLSSSRKYRLYITMAEQSVAQQEDQRLVHIILDNIGTMVCFRSASPASERVLSPLFESSLEKGQLANLPKFNFYMRLLAADPPQEPLSGMTVVVPKELGNREIAEEVVEASRHTYAIKYKEPEPAKKPRAINSKVSDDQKPEAGSTPVLKPAPITS